MKVYVVVQYAGPYPQKGNPVDIFLTEEDAEDMAAYYSQDKREDEHFTVVVHDLTPGT